jgi:hypothetical protein
MQLSNKIKHVDQNYIYGAHIHFYTGSSLGLICNYNGIPQIYDVKFYFLILHISMNIAM